MFPKMARAAGPKETFSVKETPPQWAKRTLSKKWPGPQAHKNAPQRGTSLRFYSPVLWSRVKHRVFLHGQVGFLRERRETNENDM